MRKILLMKHRNNYKYGMDSLIGNKMRYMVAIILMVMSFCGVQAQKPVILYDRIDSAMNVPDFKANFEVLAKNRVLYNTYNDSIFLIKNHGQWVNFFRRRALKNHQIFAANKVALDNIFGYFQKDTVRWECYSALAEAFAWYRQKGADDPFITLEICKILDQYNLQAPDSLKGNSLVYIWKAVTYSILANIGNDSTKYMEASKCFKRILEHQASRDANIQWSYPVALCSLLQTPFLKTKAISMKEHQAYYRMLKEWYQTHPNDTILSQTLMKKIKENVLLNDENLVRNIYMSDTTVLDKQVAESLMHKIVKRNLASKQLSDLSFVRTLAMQVWLKDISASEAVKRWMARYKKIWEKMKKKRLSSVQLKAYISPFFTFFYLNDLADESYGKKRRIVKRMCADIELAYQHRLDQQTTTDYIKYLNILTTYNRVTKYLKPKERIHFLNTLNVATQVTTYAHSVHVSMIAEELMKGILAYQPELLVGALGDLQVSDILANKRKYIDFAHDAAMYHDLGKNSIISVVNNDYRPLTDEEFAIIKRHPELGLQYLELAPSLKKFHDTTLGHHKWYNGKGGYPMSFDNTKSPKRILIDMVTLSDCMQAANERVGRNYKGDKTFDTVMAEFRKDAGVRYNPDLVALIDAHPDLAKKLADLINEGWVEIYYNIYSQYIK